MEFPGSHSLCYKVMVLSKLSLRKLAPKPWVPDYLRSEGAAATSWGLDWELVSLLTAMETSE
jgi:hypothetical protein